MPESRVKTPDARRVLPASLSRADAVFNLQRVALLLQALQTNRPALLREALRDKWHQPYRAQPGAGACRGPRARSPGPAWRLPQRVGPDGRGAGRGRHRRHRRGAGGDLRAARGAVPPARAERAQWFWECHDLLHRTSLPDVRDAVSRRSALCLRSVSRAARGHLRLRRHRTRRHARPGERPAGEPLALSRAAARQRAADGLLFRLHAAREGRPARAAAWRQRAVRQGRLGQPSDLFVQGPRGVGGSLARGGPGVRGLRLRLDGQPGQQRRGARGAARA